MHQTFKVGRVALGKLTRRTKSARLVLGKLTRRTNSARLVLGKLACTTEKGQSKAVGTGNVKHVNREQ